mgnify:CR=1 FL=1|tara:strand:- start:954 stop:1646 length:693 start_codon:yes stop_codon:yes gene_type:complete
MNTKQLTATIKGTTEDGIVAKISTNSIDRDGEVLIPQGMNASDYEKNPVLFWNHDYAEPVGNVTNLRRDDDAIYGTLTFAKRTEGVEGSFFPEVAESLVRQGVVKGISVGFVPEGGGVRNANSKDRQTFGHDVKRVYNRWKLLEVSVAPLPANQDALVEAVGKGLVTPMQVKSMFGISLEQPKSTPVVIDLKSPRRPKVKVGRSSTNKQQADPTEQARRVVARLRGQIYI